jgi:hypothetical protein
MITSGSMPLDAVPEPVGRLVLGGQVQAERPDRRGQRRSGAALMTVKKILTRRRITPFQSER